MGLQIKDISIKIQKNKIINNISITIRDGELIALLGPSGCGKSTLLKGIAGLLELESGKVLVQGKEIQNLPPEKRGTIIVFQDLHLFPHMTVEKNITFPMELKKIARKEQRTIVKQLLAEVQLPGFEQRRIQEMSGGQLQRVALARALAADPKVLLLDEPFSGLDEKLRAEMGILVKKIQRERKITTILVTHDKKEALQLSDRIALMGDGDIIQYDTPKDILHRPVSKKAADYFGKVNYLVGEIKDGIFCSPAGGPQLEYEDGLYEVLLRPVIAAPKSEVGK